MQNWPRLLFLLLIPSAIFLSFNANRYPDKLIWSDMEGYYVYLPATFIYGGFDKVQVRDKDYLKVLPGTNKIYTKYTCGAAILEAPFFLAAHALSGPLGFPSDGHSAIYSYGLMMAGVFYMLAGLLLLTVVRYPSYSPAQDEDASLFLQSAISVLEPGSLVFSSGDKETFALWYGAWASGELEQAAPGTVFVNVALFQFDWYRIQLQRQYPDLPGVDKGNAAAILHANAQQRPIFFSEVISPALPDDLIPVGLLWRYQPKQ